MILSLKDRFSLGGREAAEGREMVKEILRKKKCIVFSLVNEETSQVRIEGLPTQMWERILVPCSFFFAVLITLH